MEPNSDHQLEVKSEPNSEVDEEKQEREHFMRIVNAFKYYRILPSDITFETSSQDVSKDISLDRVGQEWNQIFQTVELAPFSVRRINDAEKYYLDLPDHHKDMIPDFQDHLNQVRVCVDQNWEIIKAIIQDAECLFENKQPQDLTNENEETKAMIPLIGDMDKVKTTLKQFVRDWSEAGSQERQTCYTPVIDEIVKRFPADTWVPSSVHVLVPGAGLGRLAYELAKKGYSCQGNEWSLFMLLSSNFVLNRCRSTNCFTLYPWIHQWTNNTHRSHQVEPINFPDVNPAELPEGANFSMAAGDFLEVYQEAGSWDCVATVFFIDTAHNIIAYIETIYKILKPGGFWVNLGPLLYHYSDVPNEVSIELSYEDVKKVIEKVGFVFEKEEQDVRSTYTQNPHSMLQYNYNSVFFVVKKAS